MPCFSAHVWHGAAAPLARLQLAAGVVVGALLLPVALHRGGIVLHAGAGRELGVPGDHHFPFGARGLLHVTRVVRGTAVVPVGAANGLGRRWGWKC